MPEKKPRVLVIGVGNLLLKDEGIGVHVVRALEKVEIPADIDLELIDGGTSPDLVALLDNTIDKLVIVDAIKTGGKPGTTYRIKPENLDILKKREVSSHELGLRQTLKIMELTGKKPKEVVIIGVEPQEIGWGTDLSPLLKGKIAEITGAVLNEVVGK